MSARDLLRSLARRWYLLVVGCLLTAGLCVGAFHVVAPSYEAHGSVLLLPPKTSVGKRGNPYLYLGGLGQAGEVLSARLNTAEVLDPIEGRHPGTTLEIGPDVTTTGPILSVTVTGGSDSAAMGALTQALKTVPPVLTRLQDDLAVPAASRITVLDLTRDAVATPVTKARERAVIALAALGFAGSLLLTGFLDGLLAAHPRRLRRPVIPAPGWTLEPVSEPMPAVAPARGGRRAARSLSDVDVATADH
jgi:uncharacterized protein involved in exopolysaccharide biosynthesis